tara:strand:+ start:291 stop:461 length:171 start_codon:yes stop_codon:yes gene_type:complete
MPTKKTSNTNIDATTRLRQRIGELTDRIAILENNLKKTQDMIHSDIQVLAERIARK